MTDVQSQKIYISRLRVEFEDCDAMGVVYHPNYFKFIERSRVDFLRSHQIPYASFIHHGTGLVVAEIQAFYWRPVRFEEEVFVYTRQIEYSQKRIVLEQFISRESLSQQEMVKPMNRITGRVFGARMTLASVDLKTLRSAPLPAQFGQKMADLTMQIEGS